jgi:hypothetical protein
VSRWTGEQDIEAVLEGADAWEERCFLRDGSLFTDQNLWTLPLLNDVLKRFADNPIEGSSRDFIDKLSEQLKGASKQAVQLAAEVIWFLLLFPSPTSMKAETKRQTISTVWSWSGEPLPASKFLDDAHLHGVGHPGTAYLTQRPSEFEYVLRVVVAFKSLPAARQRQLIQENAPWDFGAWLDEQQGSDRRLARNVFLYFLFPDDIERNTSRDHRAQIYEALKGKLPPDQRIRARNRTLLDYDRAINGIRHVLEKERGTHEVDFYQPEIKNQWFSAYREGSRKNFASWLDGYLKDRGLRLNQSGRDTTIQRLRDDQAVSPETGYWSEASGLTAKPPRWIVHFDLTKPALAATVPDGHRSRVIGFANTKGGDSGALGVRIMPVAKLGDDAFQIIETWEWLLLFCFPNGLKIGSSGQAFDDFDPASGVLTYMGEPQPYVFAGLLCLNSPEESFSTSIHGTVKEITYREATDELAKLIHVAGAAHG